MKHLTLTTLGALIASLIAQRFAEMLTAPVPLIGQFASLRLSHNAGVAFSIPLPPMVQAILIPGALVLVCIVACRSARDRLSGIGFGLILGGAIANLVDRLPDGLVTDYLSVGTFPIFNLPDACICIGAGLLLLEGVKRGKAKK
ncbi:MAG: signal peptidase II [Candidatus Peribacteraceae bacterium]|nr:signal peptidase II [Candidatus Peribacteraceae bacterium]